MKGFLVSITSNQAEIVETTVSSISAWLSIIDGKISGSATFLSIDDANDWIRSVLKSS